jgi:hypothetical protein
MTAHPQPGVGARFGDVDAAGAPDAFIAHLDRVRAQPAVQAAKARRLAASGSALGVDRSELLLAEAVRRTARRDADGDLVAALLLYEATARNPETATP